MTRPGNNSKFVAWLFVGLGAWIILGSVLDRWVFRSEEFARLLANNQFYQLLKAAQGLQEFFPVTYGMGVLVTGTGVGFLYNQPWARFSALASVGSALLGGTVLLFRSVQVLGTNRVSWVIWISWILGLALLGRAALVLMKGRIGDEIQDNLTWRTFRQLHWKAVTLGVRIFGICAILIGSALSLWGLWLLADPRATLSVNGVPTADVVPKLVVTLTPLLFIVLGVMCLFAKPNGPPPPSARR